MVVFRSKRPGNDRSFSGRLIGEIFAQNDRGRFLVVPSVVGLARVTNQRYHKYEEIHVSPSLKKIVEFSSLLSSLIVNSDVNNATRGYYFLAESNILLYYISIDRDVQPRILFIHYYRFMFESMSMV